MSAAHRAGASAFHVGLKRTDCPHDSGRSKREWQDGWDEASGTAKMWPAPTPPSPKRR